jgi:hypothetical protein
MANRTSGDTPRQTKLLWKSNYVKNPEAPIKMQRVAGIQAFGSVVPALWLKDQLTAP